jgi:hypothetical protein
VVKNPGSTLDEKIVHNQWVKAINTALSRDRLLTNKIRFGTLAFKTHRVLNTWSGLLLDEDSLPDNWLHTEKVIRGIRPMTDKTGIEKKIRVGVLHW